MEVPWAILSYHAQAQYFSWSGFVSGKKESCLSSPFSIFGIEPDFFVVVERTPLGATEGLLKKLVKIYCRQEFSLSRRQYDGETSISVGMCAPLEALWPQATTVGT
jgi:hypothetical protein